MSEEHTMSRRTSLKRLGAAGTVLVLGGPAAAARQSDSRPGGGQDKPAANVVDVAIGRFTKGHS